MERTRFFSSYSLYSTIQESQGRKTRRNSHRDHGGIMLDVLLVAYSLCFLQHKDHLAWGGIIPRGLDPLMSIISQENDLQICRQAKLMEAFTQLRFSLPIWSKLVSHCENINHFTLLYVMNLIIILYVVLYFQFLSLHCTPSVK